MSDAPETIWAWFSIPNIMHVGTWATTRFPDDATEYRRADLPATDAQALKNERVKALVEALIAIDALDPESFIDGCSPSALRGLVLRMGEAARAALAALEGK